MNRERGRELLAVRAILSVPAHDARKVAKARTRGADLLMWDLEASVPLDDKATALAAAEASTFHGDAVRVNPSMMRLEILRLSGRGLVFVVPHVESYADLYMAHRTGERFVALVESPAGIVNLPKLMASAAGDRFPLAGLAFGRWDFEDAVGFPCPLLVSRARSEVTLAAHAAGIACWDAPATLQDSSIEAQVSRAWGFTGKGCIHPRQIDDVHRAWEIPPGWRRMPFAAPRINQEAA
jgi:citrate lyase subunit beta/citryl-CoA lyase